jgi:rod shape-determining protein MreC
VAFPRRSSRTPRSRFTLGLLLLTAVTILVLDLPGTGPLDPIRNAAATVFRPIRSAAEAVFEPISNGWKGAFGYDDVTDENAELREELEDLRGQEAELARLERENRELKKIAGVDAGDIPVKTAEIVSGPLSSFEQTVEIDVGSGDSVKRGMAVITGGGVLGRIDEVRNGRASVELLTDPSVSVGVRLRNGDLAIASGQGRGEPLVVEGLEADTRVEEGDFVYTSGIDRSAFPKDLYVGRVSKVSEPVAGVARTIEVEPSADFASRYVRVVLKEAPR